MAMIAAVAAEKLAPKAVEIDEGHYPLDIMKQLAEVGSFDRHLSENGARFDLAIEAMEKISQACGSTGFLTWSHDVVALYLDQSPNAELRQRMLANHTSGDSFGGTALSNPMKALAGIEPMLLKATAVDGGWSVSGSLPWVSHIGEGQYCAAIAQVVGGDRQIMFMLAFDGRAKLRPCPKFSGMEGTSTWGVSVNDFFVPARDVVADPAQPFIERIRASFILLQTGMALGVIRGAINDMRAVEAHLGHVNQFLDDGPDLLACELDDLRSRIMTLAQTPYDMSKDYFMNVLDARLEASELSLRAAQSALLHQGAKGYLMSSAPQRRIREALFVAIVTPAIKHLRWLMAKMERDVFPVAEDAA
ncbi:MULTISPECIES: acyl-CoA dehydrogenase family protein [Agrobacterium tumefaciens complex]|uniref:acyl-CoA dehydrogenase family protein n=1 Tax=Agrobacterium tumefaciens complex TaxID=1183400 RepID=UPI001CBB0E21|nr:acyl-CoA dehydrogenase family protein [Agrobacterium tumefaciens]